MQPTGFDEEIILASVQTPFNIGDEKKLQELVKKVEQELDIKPEEITADKVYGTINNRAYLKDQCLYKDKSGKVVSKGRRLDVPLRYDAVLRDMKRVESEEFEEAINKRLKVERRFATMVKNHELRRCRYIRLGRAKIHITLANMACNIVRMVNILCPPNFVTFQS